MREIYKAMMKTLSFLLCVMIISFVIVNPWYEYYMLGENQYQDAPIRKQLSGSLNFLIIGASQAYRAFEPEVLDQKLEGVNSYNLSLPLMSMDARYFVLEKELQRNPVSTVVLEISYDVMQTDRKEFGAEGILRTLGNLDSYPERIKYFFSTVLLNEYGQVHYQTMEWGIESWKRLIKGRMPVFDIESSTKGFHGKPSNDQTITQEIFNEIYHANTYEEKPNRGSQEYLEKMIRICQEKEIRVIIVATPVSDRRLLQYDNNGFLDDYLRNITEEHECECYNFNLMKDKDSLFPEKTAYFDEGHLSESGARTFSQELAKVIMSDTPEIYFWDAYEEAENHNEYLKQFMN